MSTLSIDCLPNIIHSCIGQINTLQVLATSCSKPTKSQTLQIQSDVIEEAVSTGIAPDETSDSHVVRERSVASSIVKFRPTHTVGRFHDHQTCLRPFSSVLCQVQTDSVNTG